MSSFPSPPSAGTTFSFDWPSVIDDDADVLTQRKEEFWSKYHKLLGKDDFASLFSLANQYRDCLKGEISLDSSLLRALPHAKQARDFDRIRRIAQIGELFNSDRNSFARMVQAYCYLETGHQASAYAIVNSMKEPVSALISANKPAISNQFNVLRQFFEAVDSRIAQNPDDFYNLKI